MAQWNIADLKARGFQAWRPQTGIEALQGRPYPLERKLNDQLQVPLDPGVNLTGWINPYSLTQYQAALLTTGAVVIAPANLRRTYLNIQNQGPGNAYVSFGAQAVAPTATAAANCLQLVTTQFYEQIGGGSMDPLTGMPKPGLFVSPDYLTAITDTAGTTMLILEGVFLLSRWANVLKAGAVY